MNQAELLRYLVETLEALDIDYMIVGSRANAEFCAVGLEPGHPDHRSSPVHGVLAKVVARPQSRPTDFT